MIEEEMEKEMLWLDGRSSLRITVSSTCASARQPGSSLTTFKFHSLCVNHSSPCRGFCVTVSDQLINLPWGTLSPLDVGR